MLAKGSEAKDLLDTNHVISHKVTVVLRGDHVTCPVCGRLDACL